MQRLNKITRILETRESEFTHDCLSVKYKQRNLGMGVGWGPGM